jgi:UDP-3-O-acyl-N-acetylglucosamine deacetylase
LKQIESFQDLQPRESIQIFQSKESVQSPSPEKFKPSNSTFPFNQTELSFDEEFQHLQAEQQDYYHNLNSAQQNFIQNLYFKIKNLQVALLIFPFIS